MKTTTNEWSINILLHKMVGLFKEAAGSNSMRMVFDLTNFRENVIFQLIFTYEIHFDCQHFLEAFHKLVK
jgi:hypothetical protein